jgi:hypothetical protein
MESTVSHPPSVKVNRNGSREVMERVPAGAAKKFHDRAWYDFQAHRLWTLDLNSKIYTTQAYASAYGVETAAGSRVETSESK